MDRNSIQSKALEKVCQREKRGFLYVMDFVVAWKEHRKSYDYEFLMRNEFAGFYCQEKKKKDQSFLITSVVFHER